MFDAHPAIQASGAVNFDTVREKVNLIRCSLRMNAIVAVNNGIEDCFAEGIYDLDEIIDSLIAADQAAKLANLQEA